MLNHTYTYPHMKEPEIALEVPRCIVAHARVLTPGQTPRALHAMILRTMHTMVLHGINNKTRV